MFKLSTEPPSTSRDRRKEGQRLRVTTSKAEVNSPEHLTQRGVEAEELFRSGGHGGVTVPDVDSVALRQVVAGVAEEEVSLVPVGRVEPPRLHVHAVRILPPQP